MAAHNQALLIQGITLVFILGTIADAGRMFNGVLVACVLFWLTFFALYWSHRGALTGFDLFFLRWGSVAFVILGIFVLSSLVEEILKVTLYPLLRRH